MTVPRIGPIISGTMISLAQSRERPISTSCRRPNAAARTRRRTSARPLKGIDVQALGPRHRHIDEWL
jgi:hypothetical protein